MNAGVEGNLALARARARLLATWERWQEARSRGEEYQGRAECGLLSLREMYADLARTHFRAAAMHLSSARLQASYVARLQEHLEHPGVAGARPMFMAEVARILDAASAAVYVPADVGVAAVGVVSDDRVRRFQDVELAIGEGPTIDVMTTGEVAAADCRALSERWPHLALAVADLGVRGVAAAPLRGRAHPVGALTVVNPRWVTEDAQGLLSLRGVAAWVTETVGDEMVSTSRLGVPVGETQGPLSPLLHDARLGLLHHAVGRIAEEVGCDADTALALIRAHSFAESIDLGVLAEDIAAGRRRLDL